MRPSDIINLIDQPFHVNQKGRKWPDGLCTASVSSTYSFSTTFQTRHTVVTILLFAGKTVSLTAVDGNGVVLAWHGDNKSTFTHDQVANVDGRVFFPTRDSPVYWRPVSIGMTVVVNGQPGQGVNDGWFVASRFSTNSINWGVAMQEDLTQPVYDEEAVALSTVSQTRIKIKPGDIFPVFVPDIRKSPNMQVGAIKDLNNAIFKLNPTSKRNEFIPNKYFTFENNKYISNYSPSIRSYQFKYIHYNNESTKVINNLKLLVPLNGRQFESPSIKINAPDTFDCIALNLYVSRESIITLSSVCHQELLYSDDIARRYNYEPGWTLPNGWMDAYLSVVSEDFKTPFYLTQILKDRYYDINISLYS